MSSLKSASFLLVVYAFAYTALFYVRAATDETARKRSVCRNIGEGAGFLLFTTP